ncbi:DUF3572 domain-containing protein [Hyphomicrobium sp.]|uniref:DUF3572 domain-containing protein n=1 Tax=Hyphomicrobium sp. TaxID=82 RepID=UPI0025C613AA|nr:DUF3572 domain-containing protein [Hyphomicrobium sp.]MCC7250395.1 DUF3572 domain-containing protein [Hyphomicrobium sp.]
MLRRAARPSPEDTEEAAMLALAGLTFLAEDGPRLGRFLAMTGIGPDQLRAVADAPETLLAVLDHLLGDESLLLVFTASKGIAPERVAPARSALARALGVEAAHE